MKLELPENVPGFNSTNVPEDLSVTNTLPKDTSYAQRRYVASDGFFVMANLVLMGTDRTSIHKPEFCLPSQGWRIDQKSLVTIPIAGVPAYELPVARWWLSTSMKTKDGGEMGVRGLYVFWFVADKEQTTDHWRRIYLLARDLLSKGILQRWAYVSYFTVCGPGQEDATFERVKQLIAATVPEFQLPPENPGSSQVVEK
jgi:hypothetical protein